MKNKKVRIAISILLILISYGFITYKILSVKELVEFDFSLHVFTFADLQIIILVFFLMICNWSIEAIKWKVLIDKIQILKFTTAFKAVLSGITIGLFTPNRIGDIGGRVLFLEKGKRTYGVLATSVVSFSQLLTTISTGIIGFILFLFLYPEKSIINQIFNMLTGMLLLVLLLILIWIYFNIRKVSSFFLKFKFFRKRRDQIEYFSKIQFNSLLTLILFSFIRYAIFSSQFFFLLLLFNVQISVISAYTSISLIYLFATLIPTTTLIELGIRGSLAIFFIGMFSNNILGIILSAMFLWFINLAIPAMIGAVFFLKNQLIQRNK